MSAEELPAFIYSCVEDWFINLLAPTIERRLDASGASTLTWCPEWWQHPEAIARLEASWRAWEVCRDADGEAPSRWFWQHCDPMLAVLMDAKAGPLSDCKPDAHRKYDAASTLPYKPAPAGYWGNEVATSAQSACLATKQVVISSADSRKPHVPSTVSLSGAERPPTSPWPTNPCSHANPRVASAPTLLRLIGAQTIS